MLWMNGLSIFALRSLVAIGLSLFLPLSHPAISCDTKSAATWQNVQTGCAPSEDSDQPGHPSSLIRVFAVRMKKAWVLSYPMSASKDSDPESLLGANSFCWFWHVLAQIFRSNISHVSQRMAKLTKYHVRPAKTRISLEIRPVWSASSLSTVWVAKDPFLLHAGR